MHKNHIEVIEKENCTGCGVCAYICPQNAIVMKLDDEGFYTPVINKDKCIACGMCLKKCHLIVEHDSKKQLFEQYAVRAKDRMIIENSRSGGICYILGETVIKQGGVVIGAVLQEDFTVSHNIANDLDDLKKLSGSKYVQSSTHDIINDIKKELNKKVTVLFIGTPCQVSAMSKVFSNEENLILCDFVCHGVPSPLLWQSYLDWCKKKYKGEITSVCFRDKKKYGWEKHVERMDINGKHIWSKRYANLFSESTCLRESCYKCHYTKIDRVSDITVADYWGIESIVPKYNDGLGASLVMIHTNKGKELFNNSKEKFDYTDTRIMPPTHYNLKHPTERPKCRDAFYCELSKYGFDYVSRKYGHYSLLRRVKNFLLYRIR